MDYKLIDSEFKLEPKVIIPYRTFTFTLPGLHKKIVAHGKYIIEEATLACASFNFKLDMDNLPLISFDWIHKNLDVNTSGDKNVIRSSDFTDAIKKRTKGWEKIDTKAIIDAFEADYQDILKKYMITKAKVLKKPKVTKSGKSSKKRR